jgi:hypothetical protein
MPWRIQMGEIQDRLERAEDARAELVALRPNAAAAAAAVANIRSQLEAMRLNMDRLHFGNWRHVALDLCDVADDITDSGAEFDEDG